MDLSQITLTQISPANQFGFDADSLDQSILKAERRAHIIWKIWAALANKATDWAANARHLFDRAAVIPRPGSAIE